MAWSGDGRLIVAVGIGGTLWTVAGPGHAARAGSLPPTGVRMTAVAVRPDSGVVAVGDADGRMRLWDVADPELPSELTSVAAADGEVTDAQFSPDGRLLVVARRYRTTLWDVSDPAGPAPRTTLVGGADRNVSAAAFSPDGRTLATGDDTGIQLWDLTRPAPTLTPLPPSSTGGPVALEFGRDGRTLVSVKVDHIVIVWDVPRRIPIARLPHASLPLDAAVSPRGDLVATGGLDGVVRLWHRPSPVLDHQGGTVTSLTVDNTGRLLATTGTDRSVRLWDVSDPARPRARGLLTRPTGAAEAVVGADARSLLVLEGDGTARLFDIADPDRPLEASALPSAVVTAAEYAPDGRTLATGGPGGTVEIWDIQDLRAPRLVTSRSSFVTDEVAFALAFAPDGRHLAAGWPTTVVLWDLTRPPTAIPWAVPSSADSAVVMAYSPDGRLLAISGQLGTVKLWDVSGPDPRLLTNNLRGHTAPVAALAFAPDGRTLASGGRDGAVHLWDVASVADDAGTPAATLTASNGWVNGLAFVGGGATLAVADSTAWLIEPDPARAAERVCAHPGSPITPEEWRRFLPDRRYDPPCG